FRYYLPFGLSEASDGLEDEDREEDAEPPVVEAPIWNPDLDLGVFAVNEPLSITIESATGSEVSYDVVSGMPAGLGFDPSNRRITGTPTDASDYDIVLSAFNEGGNVNRTFSLRVEDAVLDPC